MASRAEVVIKLRTDGEEKVRRALSGIVKDAGKAQQALARQRTAEARAAEAAEKQKTRVLVAETKARAKVQAATIQAESRSRLAAARVVAQTERQKTREAVTARRAEEQAAKRAQQEEARIARELTKTEEAENRKREASAKRLRKAQVRAARQAFQEEQRAQLSAARGRERSRAAMAAGVVGIGSAAIDRARGWQGAIGAPSRDEMARGFMDFQRGLIGLQGQTHMSDADMARVREQLLTSGQRNLVGADQMLAGANVAQNRFSNLGMFTQNADAFAAASTALNTPIEDIVGAVGEMQRGLQVPASEIPALIGMMSDAASKGSIEFSNISSEFSAQIGTFGRVTGLQGMGAARQFNAMAQVLGAGGAGAAGSSTLAANLMAKFANGDVQANLSQAGLSTTGPNGQFDLASFIDRIRSDRRFVAANGSLVPGGLQDIFGNDMQANQALGILISQANTAAASGQANPLNTIANSDANAGTQAINATNERLRNSASGRAMAVSVDAQANFIRNGDQLVNAMINVGGGMSDLESRYPALTEAMGFATDAAKSFAQVFIALRLAGTAGGISWMGGNAIGTSMSGPAAMAAAAPAAGAAGAGMSAAVGASPLAAAGVGIAGFMIGQQIGDGILTAVTSLTGQQAVQSDETGFAGIGSLYRQIANWGDVAHATGPTAGGGGQGNQAGQGDLVRAIQQAGADQVREQRAVRTAIQNIPTPTAPNAGDTRPNGRP